MDYKRREKKVGILPTARDPETNKGTNEELFEISVDDIGRNDWHFC